MKTILCIDEDKDVLNGLTIPLESAGYNVLTSFNIKNGFDPAKVSRPDLILPDATMESETDGFRFSDALRRDDDLHGTPLLMLTPVNKKTGFTFNPEKDGEFLPVDGFFEKPVKPALPVEKAEELLNLSGEQINLGC